MASSFSSLNDAPKSSILEKILSHQIQNEHKNLLDEVHLKKINSIVSNLPYEIIKKAYEKADAEARLELKKTQTQIPAQSRKNPKSTRNKSNSSLRRKQLHKSSSKSRRSDSVDNKETTSSFLNKTATSKSTFNSSSQIYLNTNNQIVIHVCDEAKRLKQDFTCPRELLVKEMKYFSYNLNINVTNSSQNGSGAHAHSSLSQTALSKKSLDEIDISVHCDINIFDWLMRYVKRSHPYLIEKSVTQEENLSESNNYILYSSDQSLKYIEPKLEIINCVSILLSSDFLLMGDLVDKCILFIAKNLESVIQVPCVMSGISEPLLSKLAACVNINKLNDCYDRKDKLKTKLFQRKLEFMFDLEKYRQVFKNSSILNDWKHNRFDRIKLLSLNIEQEANSEDNYTNYLYDCENNATGLFKCKLCSRLMTKQQSLNLKCKLALLSKHGDYIYLHVPDDRLDLTSLLQLLRDKLKSWQSVYWFVWSLIKSFKCKKCNEWFRLVEMNRCRLNNNTFCDLHDSTIHNSSSCSCIHSDHVLDNQSATQFFSKSPIITEISAFESPELRLNKFLQFIMENFEKNRDAVCNGPDDGEGSEKNDFINSLTFCDSIETTLKLEHQAKEANSNKNSKITNPANTESNQIESSFTDSITGKHVSLINKDLLNLIKISQTNSNTEANSNQFSLDLRAYLCLIPHIDPMNLLNSLDILTWLRVEPKMKWDIVKPTRLNQDNQREDDLKRFREISSYLIRAKLADESTKPLANKSPIAIAMANIASLNSNSLSNFAGGIYCRVENEWKQRNFP